MGLLRHISERIQSPKKVKASKIDNKQKALELDAREQLDLEEEAYDEYMPNLGKQNRSIKPIKSQVKQQFKVAPVKKENDAGETMTSFQQLKINLVKGLKEALGRFVDFKLDFNYYARSELLNLGLRKLGKYLQQKKIKNWIIHLFYVIDSHVILNEYLRKHRKNPIAEKLQYYSDAIYYRTFFCIEEYADNTCQYISLSFNKLSLNDSISVLESLAPYALIASVLGENYQQVAFSPSLLPVLGLEAGLDTEMTLIANIIPLADREIIGEIFHWISKIVDKIAKEGLSTPLCFRVMRLLVNMFANTWELDDNLVKTLVGAIELLLDTNPFKEYQNKTRPKRKGSKVESSDEVKNQFLQNVLNIFTELNVLDEEGLDGLAEFYKAEGFVTITIESNIEKAEENLNKSEQAWLLDSRTIAQRITLRRKLNRLFFKRAEKVRAPQQVGLKMNHVLELISSAAMSNSVSVKELERYLMNSSVKTDIFEWIDNRLLHVLTYYGRNTLQSPIDFHYIWNSIQKTIGCGLEYVNALVEGVKSKDNRKRAELQEVYKEKMAVMENISNEFDKWCRVIESQGKGDDKFIKKKKLVSTNWEEEALLVKMQQIAKKRKGLRKQVIQTKKVGKSESFKKKLVIHKVQTAIQKKRGFKTLVKNAI